MSLPDLSYDGEDRGEDDGPPVPAASIPDLRMEPARQLEEADTSAQQRGRLYAALDRLDQRSRCILQARWLGDKKDTLHELADRFGVSAERIRQIEKAAMRKLRLQLAA